MIDVKGLLNANLPVAWALLDSVLKSCQYKAVVSLPYDVATGTAGESVTTTPLKVFIFDHDLSMIDGGADIRVTDKRALLLAAHLPDIAGREKSEPNDKLVDHLGREWLVLLSRGDPDFYFDLTLRR